MPLTNTLRSDTHDPLWQWLVRIGLSSFGIGVLVLVWFKKMDNTWIAAACTGMLLIGMTSAGVGTLWG